MNISKQVEAPILLIAFNRPDTTKVVFDRIRKIQPKKFYIAIDGSRIHKTGEIDLCQKVLEITKKVDWNCEANYLIRDKNLGCKDGVTGAISLVFEKEDRVIVIEDDIAPTIPFFNYAEELLSNALGYI